MYREHGLALLFTLAVAGCGSPTCPQPGVEATIQSYEYEVTSVEEGFLGEFVPPGGLGRQDQRLEVDRSAGTATLRYLSQGREIVEVYAITATTE